MLLQTVLLLAAGVALLRLWRVAASGSRLIGLLTAGGLLLRAGQGVALFWISYLELPFARSLQLGNGFWFFATDATAYFGRAVSTVSSGGPAGIIMMERTYPSVFYNQVLAAFVWLLGSVPSVGLLLNLFAYLGTAALIVIWARRYAVPASIVALPIAAITYSPSWILWSSQPLKDAFFCFITICFALTIDQWVREWRAPELRPWRIAAVGVLLAFLIYGIAGVRWYYAFVALILVIYPIFSVVFARTTARQRAVAAAAGVALLFVMSRQVIFGAGPYLPQAIQDLLRFRGGEVVRGVTTTVEASRRSLDTFVNSGTRIRAGKALRDKPRTAAAARPKPKPTPVATPVPPRAALPVAHPAAPTVQPAAPAARPATPAVKPAIPATKPATPAVHPATPVAKPATPAAKPATPVAKPTTPIAKPATPVAKPATPVAKPATPLAKPATPVAKPATPIAKPATPIAKPATPIAKPATPIAKPATPIAKPATPVPTPAAPRPSILAQSEEAPAAASDVPQTVGARLIAGFAALLLPHAIAEGLGLVSLGAARGFWWFADVDTVLFDTFLILSFAIFLRRWRDSWRDPFAWYLVGVSCAIAGALAYTISNFGALFRHRSMVLAAIVLLPLAASRARSRTSRVTATEPAPERLPNSVPLPSTDG
ncbi:MAG TPA: hypothetical protein VND45_08505 [Thermoanaerobaculia bacterium]|nr:hypothetical protein [Thermoanaerobaculia bacterium]